LERQFTAEDAEGVEDDKTLLESVEESTPRRCQQKKLRYENASPYLASCTGFLRVLRVLGVLGFLGVESSCS
jgi:hypothetical protein